MSPAHVQALVIRGRTQLPYAPVTIKTDAGAGVETVLGERAGDYPGVLQKPVSIRDYPLGEMAAQVLGYVGEVSTPELKLKAFRGVQRARSSARKGSSTTTTATCAAPRGGARGGQRQRLPGSQPAGLDPAARRARAAGDARSARCRRRAKRRCARGSNTHARAANRRSPARSWRWTRATAKSSRSAPTPRSTPTASPNR